MPDTSRLEPTGSGGAVSTGAGGISIDAVSCARTSSSVLPTAPLASAPSPRPSELPRNLRRDQSGISAGGPVCRSRATARRKRRERTHQVTPRDRAKMPTASSGSTRGSLKAATSANRPSAPKPVSAAAQRSAVPARATTPSPAERISPPTATAIVRTGLSAFPSRLTTSCSAPRG